MAEKFYKTTDKDKAALLWLVTESKPILNLVDGGLQFQFLETDELLCLAAKYDTNLPVLLCPRKLRQVERIIDTHVTIFLTKSGA